MSHTEKDSFCNDDVRLREEAKRVLKERSDAGLEGLVGGLDHVLINVEPDHQQAAVEEWIRSSSYSIADAFENADNRTCVLKAENSADVLICSRLRGSNPFAEVNRAPKTAALPNTRIEAFGFETPDVEAYVKIQRTRGVQFLGSDIQESEHYRCIQTMPSRYTGNSIGLIQWTGERSNYRNSGDAAFELQLQLPQDNYRQDIGLLDHAATRVTTENRDPAILEFMALTNYRFEFALYIAELNSITNVARLPGADFAMVFTSGIRPSVGEAAGPTEQFVQNYGARVHHLALQAKNIEAVYAALEKEGVTFLSGLVGSPEEGLKQAFSVPSSNTLVVTEYIQRYDGFDGFFTRNNVALLTEATSRQ